MEILKIEDYGYENLHKLVEKEIDLIRENFDVTKLSNLDSSDIDATSPDECIYGQLFGNCNSPQVLSFINDQIPVCFTSIEMKNSYGSIETYRSCHYQTPLEIFIQPFPEEEITNYEEETSDQSIDRINRVLYLLTK